jgi:hypothetical protein
MILADLIAAFRARADDTAKPYLWRDQQILDWLNEAETEACERGTLLRDSQTSSVCELSIQAGEGEYALHPSVIRVLRVKPAQARTPLPFIALTELDDRYSDWEKQTNTPTFWTLLQPGVMRFVPIPKADDEVRLIVLRRPLQPIPFSDSATPEIPERYHSYLISWALHRAFQQRDADSYDETRSQAFLAEFERIFGERVSAYVEALRQSSQNWVTGYGGY